MCSLLVGIGWLNEGRQRRLGGRAEPKPGRARGRERSDLDSPAAGATIIQVQGEDAPDPVRLGSVTTSVVSVVRPRRVTATRKTPHVDYMSITSNPNSHEA
jgi:hypothetical protein